MRQGGLIFAAGRVRSEKKKLEKKKKKKNLAKKTKKRKTTIRNRLGKGTLNTCAKTQVSYLSKTAWTLDSEGNWGSMLEPACIHVYYIHRRRQYGGRLLR